MQDQEKRHEGILQNVYILVIRKRKVLTANDMLRGTEMESCRTAKSPPVEILASFDLASFTKQLIQQFDGRHM